MIKKSNSFPKIIPKYKPLNYVYNLIISQNHATKYQNKVSSLLAKVLPKSNILISVTNYHHSGECIGVTDWVVKSISENAQSHLQYIDLSWCSLITDNALFSLSQYQHQLISLNLSIFYSIKAGVSKLLILVWNGS